jgi:hypothetical protein
MSSFVHIFVFSYCFGLIAFKFKEKYKSLLLDFLKGLLCVVLAGAYVNTGLFVNVNLKPFGIIGSLKR